MQILIITDLEGPAGVERFSQTRAEPFVAAAKCLLTNEVNAAIAGIIDVDPQAVIHVVDGHGSGGINKEDMDQRGVYIRPGSSEALRDKWDKYDAYMYVGQHAMAGTAKATLSHTQSSKYVVYQKLNGVFIGEFGRGAARAGYHGVPTVFIAGDDKAVAEAQGLIPGIYGVITKWGEGWQKARHLSPEESCRRIREVIAEACRNIHKIKPLRFDPPYSSEHRFTRPRTAVPTAKPGVRVELVDPYTVRYRSDHFEILP